MSAQSSPPSIGTSASSHVGELRLLRAALAELQARLRRLEQEWGEVEEGELIADRFGRWLEEHLDELEDYPDQYVAYSPERGILAAAADEKEFARKLDALQTEGDYATTHTSLYLTA